MRIVTSPETSTWVVDASVAFGWFASVSGSDQAVRLLEQDPASSLVAPDLVLVELLNAGWKAERMGAITAEQFQAIADLAPDLFASLVPAAELLPLAHGWCRRLDHPAYDCLYLALAEAEGCTLVTSDQRLLRKLGRAGARSDLAIALEDWKR